jgi:hyperosmotically inducible protein
MNAAAWNVVPVLALLTLAPVGTSARGTAAEQNAGEKTVGQKTKAGAVKTKDAVVKGAKVVGEKTKDGLSKTGELMTDGWITTRVKSRFVNEDLLKDSDISVDTDKHVVTLEGTVTKSEGRTKAGDIARRTEGVRHVVNRLTIGAKR